MARVLIVEDSKLIRGFIKKYLADDGHDFFEAENGKEGLELIVSEKPDCILLDLLMPDVGGLEVLKKLQEQGNETPVIVMTADVQAGIREQCIQFGAKSVLNKPPKRDLLRIEVAKLLGGE